MSSLKSNSKNGRPRPQEDVTSKDVTAILSWVWLGHGPNGSPLLEGLADYHRRGRYGFTRPGIAKVAGQTSRQRRSSVPRPFERTSSLREDSQANLAQHGSLSHSWVQGQGDALPTVALLQDACEVNVAFTRRAMHLNPKAASEARRERRAVETPNLSEYGLLRAEE